MTSNILIIDDDPVMATTVETLIRAWGHTAFVAQSGEEGLELLNEEPIDLVVTDVMMPGISGLDLQRKIKVAYPHLPVILITGHGNIPDAVKSIQDGAFDYILKPPDADQFQIVANRALKHAHLHRENVLLRNEMKAMGREGCRMIGSSPKMRDICGLIKKVAKTDSTVLVTGDTGTGKEVTARAIHFMSNRADRPMVAVNCAALNPQLLESELFGHEKGAFTGAITTRKGRFEDADGGTLFLDEISETSPEFQAKLLRILQESEFQRVGGNANIKVDVRIIASSNQNLEEAVQEKTFREDLYYRLRVVPVHLPPLSERQEDIPLLARSFLDHFNETFGTEIKGFTEEAMAFLKRQSWPGNVRELKHTIERAVILASSDQLDVKDVSFDPGATVQKSDTAHDLTLDACLDKAATDHLLKVLDHHRWNHQAASDTLLGIGRSTLYRLLKKHCIQNPNQPETVEAEAD